MPKFKFEFNKNVVAGFLYFGGMFFICMGIILSVGLDNNTYKHLKNSANVVGENVSTKELINAYTKFNKKNINPVLYNSFTDAIYNAKYFPTSFKGKLVHYGPDCPMCSGRLGCNGQDARNGNIYYNDKEYGKIRIVAMSASIPCGSIIKINVKAYDSNGMYAIVLDRGVSGPMVDLLKVSGKSKSPVRTMNGVKFDIVRYGY